MSKVGASKKSKIQHPIRHEKVHLEPVKKSILDGLKENLRISQRTTYVHRMIYIGETIGENVNANLKDAMDKIIKSVNDHYCDEKLTGFLFYHQQYFTHFLDGSEETLVKHLRLLFGSESIKNQLGRMKLLVIYHHVNMRILDEWMAITAKPPTLLEQVDMNADLAQAMDKVRYCVEKLYGIGNAVRPVDILIEDQASEGLTEQAPATQAEQKKSFYGKIVNPIYPYLPELSILEFLLTTNFTQDLRKYLDVYGSVPYIDSYEDLVWPVPCDFVPMNIFEEEIDPITDLTVEIPT